MQSRYLRDMFQDAAFALRMIRKQPGFATVAALSAALGIGACSLIFSLANAALFHPLPVDDPSHLMAFSGKNLRRGKIGQSMSYPDFEDLRHARSFEGVAAFVPFLPAAISGAGAPARYWGSMVSANYFDVVRPSFILGHGFDPAGEGSDAVVVLSYSLWHSRFQADPTLAGRTIELNHRKVTVVGVTGPGFRGTEAMFYSDFWLPLSMMNSLPEIHIDSSRVRDRSGQWLYAAGRLRKGFSEEAAASEVDVIAARLRAAYHASNRDRGFHVERAGQINPGVRKIVVVFFFLLLLVAVLVLCTACANVANLLLARAASRQKEMATRLAIGAGRSRIVRQLLTESVILALLGGVGGYAIARFGASALSTVRLPIGMPVDLSVSPDYRVLLFCAVLSMLTGLIFGLVPSLRATRPNLTGALKDEPLLGRSRRFGLRNLLVVAQVSICMLLLICSGLFLRSLSSAFAIDPGFSHRNVLLVAFDPSLNRYSPEQARRVVDTILDRTGSLPGVESAAITSSIPLNLEGTQNGFVPEGGPQTPIMADIYSVSPRYFETLGIRWIAGEDFGRNVAPGDTVIINQALADRAFPQQNPIGRYISYFGRSVRITGLAANTKSRSIGEDPRPCLYFPIDRDPRGNDSLSGMTLLVRTQGNPAAYTQPVREAIQAIDPDLALFDIRTMDTQLSRALFVPRMTAILFGSAGAMGLLIAIIGLYGVISFAVARQTREIGIRMALGARPAQVLGSILRHGVALTLTGSALGLAAALALGRFVSSLLYGVNSSDAATFITVPALLLVIAILACLIPARRAASLDPLRALRYE